MNVLDQEYLNYLIDTRTIKSIELKFILINIEILITKVNITTNASTNSKTETIKITTNLIE